MSSTTAGILTPTAKDPALPSYQSAAYRLQLERWQLCADLRAGTDVMRERGQRYLPQTPWELPKEYEERLEQAEFYNGFARTIGGLAGMVFRKPPVLEAAGAEVEADWTNIDGAGTAGDVFLGQVFEEALAKGHTFIFVDKPPVRGRVSLDQERRLGLRPYWIHVRPEQVLSARTRLEGGLVVLAQAVIREETTEPAGGFGEKCVVRYRVLRHEAGIVSWELWEERKSPSAAKVVKVREGVFRGIQRIPLVCVYAGEKLGTFHTKPPLLDLAYTNIAHYQVSADHRHSMHRAAIPILVMVGRDTSKDAQPVGPNVGIDVPIGGSVEYAEHSGAGLGHIREHLQDLETQMAAQGLAMLQRESRAAETAEAKRIDKSEQDSRLAKAARALEDAVDVALELHAQYRGVTPGSLSLNVDYESLTLDAATIETYSRLVDTQKISLDTFWQIMAAAGALPKEFDREKELVRIGEESLTRMGGTQDAGDPDPSPPPQEKPDAP